MPSIFTWDYDGGEDGSPDAERRGKQRVYAGDGAAPVQLRGQDRGVRGGGDVVWGGGQIAG